MITAPTLQQVAPGVILDTTKGLISGIPTKIGTYQVSYALTGAPLSEIGRLCYLPVEDGAIDQSV